MNVLHVFLVACLLLAAAVPSTAQTSVSLSDGDDDGFGGTQGSNSNPGDTFTPFSSPTVAPGMHGVSNSFTDRTTIAPWTPYTFSFFFGYAVSDPSLIQSVTIAIQVGGVARRADDTGYGHAAVQLEDLATSESLVLGDLLEIDTGTPESLAENQVRMPTWDITEFIEARSFDTLLELKIDGSALVNPGDQFALDYAILTVYLVDATTTTTTTTLPPTTTSTLLPSTTTTLPPTTTTLEPTTTTAPPTTTTTIPEPAPLCGGAPRTGCMQASPGKASVLLSNPSDAAKRKLKFKWKGGDPVSAEDFGNPVTGTPEYALCLYDASAAAQPLMQASIPTGTCGEDPCWKAAGAGFKFKDKTASPHGITSALLKPGDAGKAQVKISGKGGSLPLPALGLIEPVTIQLVVDNGAGIECWQTAFTDATTNDGDTYKAKGP